MKTFTNTLVLLGSLGLGADAFWRMECPGRVGLARVDPLVSFGIASQHVHAIHGSSGFGMSSTYDDLRAADCTSCRVKQDKSAYWHPAVYFQDAATGEYEIVPQVGGMLSYYLLVGKDIKAFPPGFHMIAGDTRRRTYTVGDPSKPDPGKSDWAALGQTNQADLQQRAIGFNCLNYGQAPEGTLYRHFMPDKAFLDANCANGLRFELMFPSCWNGQDLDTPNHQDHVAYPDLIMDGNCPEGFTTRVPSLLYETIWNTYAFKDRAGRFVIGNGDTLGFGYHGDFMTGWDKDFLQQAINTCTNPSGRIEDCPIFDLQDENTSRQCEMKIPGQLSGENVTISANRLPGNVAIVLADGSIEGGGAPPADAPSQNAPTLTYQPGTPAASSDAPLPGEVFKEKSNNDDSAYGAAAVPAPAAVVETPTPSPAAEPPAPPPAPEPTPPAPEPAPPAETKSFYSTQTVTVGNIVSLIFWEEETVYVTEYEDVTTTMTVTAGPAVKKAKRQILHHHGHRHHK